MSNFLNCKRKYIGFINNDHRRYRFTNKKYFAIIFKIPVYIGAYESLIPNKEPPIYFHGKDGFGDLEHDTEPDLSIVKEEHAGLALNRIINNNPKSISIMALGPLTNLALAIKLNKSFGNNIKDIWIMGGNYTGKVNYSNYCCFLSYKTNRCSYLSEDITANPVASSI